MRLSRKVLDNEKGFTLVELLIVMIVSLIMLAGMVGLLEMSFNAFSTGKRVQALADASRRVLPAMDRQMKGLLHINNAECVTNYKVAAGVWKGISFYSDINNDNPTANVENYDGTTGAEKVEFYQESDKLMQKTTYPDPAKQPTITSLCSYVDSVRFYYFPVGVAPGNGSPPSGYYTGDTPNENAGSVKAVITLTKEGMTKTYEQNTFFRILQRSATGT
jgi:prepilin-type N-terminal cleavage/methylation domain-containing protein